MKKILLSIVVATFSYSLLGQEYLPWKLSDEERKENAYIFHVEEMKTHVFLMMENVIHVFI
ncbi:hypothetical protein [Capnocytophaga catalasegens]|uniref:Uncharacterized protein n=1 Tax=Capnocytophaga catalasegens TaxID=1004260 RepID=A0AAV5AZ46_9FLAO|nr:hypothetical protein [Capnocytophaga catalasegens]GIZ15735.1 hypothetical protein RCZ03_17350 [Capnocytophaga catalasegens]GJM50122.1 hypothetical protein RCZ15_10960 [Capnocytophaga catalasegens]GJM53053.1 hypothetical protein RCZ16_13700 [Capnocytophaga catalasegens]